MRTKTAAGAAFGLALVLTGLSLSSHYSNSSRAQYGDSGAVAGGAPSYCKLSVTWTTGASLTIAEFLDTTAVSSCDNLASELTRGSDGDFTAVSDGTLTSMPTGICSDDGVTLVNSPQLSAVACDALQQDINYLVVP